MIRYLIVPTSKFKLALSTKKIKLKKKSLIVKKHVFIKIMGVNG